MNNEDMNIKLINTAFDEIFGKESGGDDELFKKKRFHSMSKDERLDDPRHGQADEINRRNRDGY